MSLNQTIKDVLTEGLERFLSAYPGTVDELVLLRDSNIVSRKNIIPYFVVPPRTRHEGFDYVRDTEKLVAEIRKSDAFAEPFRIVSVDNAYGTRFDAAIFLPEECALLLNSKKKTWSEVVSDPGWPELELELWKLAKRLGSVLQEG